MKGMRYVLLLAILGGSSAYTKPSLVTGRTAGKMMPKNMMSSARKMAESETDAFQETNILKKDGLIYDPRTGRFFEKKIEEVCRDEFCTIDEKTGEQVVLTLQEKERIFVDALQAYYFDGRSVLTDDDFDKLKTDLAWEGSEYASLTRSENAFISAKSAYLKGKPIMSDEEFDALKNELKETGSKIAVNTEPKCYIDTGICTVTFTEDKFRMATLYIPPFLIATLLWIGFAYEIFEPFRALNPLATLLIGSPLIYAGTKVGTENVSLNIRVSYQMFKQETDS